MEDLTVENDILSNIHEKLKSVFYLDKINIDGIEFEVYEKNKECFVLLCKTGNSDDGSDGLAVRLPLPLRFDEEWFMKYKEINLSVGSIIAYNMEGFLK